LLIADDVNIGHKSGCIGIEGDTLVSNSNVVYLPIQFESKKKQRSLASRAGFASPRETLELLTAFSRIESPIFRRMPRLPPTLDDHKQQD
jgi:hypothetical protein